MNTTSRIGRVLLCALLGAATVVAAAAAKQQYITHTVVRGETVSFICIKYYGRYTPELARSIRTANPSIADINLVQPGQTLRLRRPLAPGQAAAAALPPREAAIFEQQLHAQQGVVTYASGTLRLTRGAKTAPVGVNTILQPGDVLETGADGRAEIIINRESVVRIKEHSRITIESLRDAARDTERTTVGFSLGTLWAKVRETRDRICRFELALPTAIAGVHGTVYQTSVRDDRSAEVKVYTGEVAVRGRQVNTPSDPGQDEVAGPSEVAGPREVSMEEWLHIIRAMQRIAIDRSGRAAQPDSFARNTDDEWEQFNEERDRQIDAFIGPTLPLPR